MSLWYDLRYTIRQLIRTPLFALVAVLSLGLAIGVNSAVFSVYNALFLRELPYRDPGRLVNVYTTIDDMEHATFSWPDYRDLREQSEGIFTDVVVANVSLAILDRGPGEPGAYLFGEMVSGTYWQTLGMSPVLGRAFSESDDEPGAPPVVMLGHSAWQKRFGGDPAMVGSTVRLNGEAYTVIGIAPAQYRGMFPLTAEYIVPIRNDPTHRRSPESLEQRGARNLFVRARLAPGVTAAGADAAVRVISERLAEQYPESNRERHFTAIPSREVAILPLVDGPLRQFSLFLLLMAGLTLLVACINLAGMLLARAAARQREVAVRLALGAPGGRLVRQMLTESLLLGLVGALAGLAVAAGLLHLLNTLQPPIPIPINLDIRMDGQVLLYTALLAVATGLFFGLVPALQARRTDLLSGLHHSTSAGGAAGRRVRLRRLLVVAQVAFSALLLVCAALFLRSLGGAGRVDPGFSLQDGVVTTLELQMRGYSSEQAQPFYEQLRERIEALPGVASAALVDRMPLGASVHISDIYPITEIPLPDEGRVDIDVAVAGPGYFETMGIPLLEGRTLLDSDGPDSVPVVVVNRTFAARFWPEESAVGKQIRRSSDGDPFEIIGVVADGKYRTLGEKSRPFIWFAFAQRPGVFMSVVAGARGQGEAAAQALKPEIHRVVRQIDPQLPVFEMVTMREHQALMLFIPRTLAALLGGLGGLALLLGVVGLYGIIAFDVHRRSREIGIRMAMGAGRAQLIREVIGDGLKLSLTGGVLGLVAAFLLTPQLQTLLYGVGPRDPAAFTVIALLLVAITVAATWGPAWRAATLDPVRALRQD